MDNPDAGEPVDGGSPGETEPEKCKGIVNCYFMRGGVLDKVNDVKWNEEEWKDGFLAFSIAAGVTDEGEDENGGGQDDGDTIRFFESFAALSDAQRDPDFYVYPLYKLDADGGVELDLRSVINLQLYEAI